MVRNSRPLSLDAYAPDCIDQIYLVASAGYSDDEIARVCGVSSGKLKRWRLLYPDFDKAILNGRLMPDMHVLQATYRRAVGYELPVVTKTVTRGPDGVTTAVKTETAHYPGDAGQQRFWLQNRMGWKDKKITEAVVTHELGVRMARALERAGAHRVLPPLIDVQSVTLSDDTLLEHQPVESAPTDDGLESTG